MSTTEQAVNDIADGSEPVWQETFEHPKYGPLTFTIRRMPKVTDWIAHAQAQQAIAPGLEGAAATLPAAVAGMQTFMEVPVVKTKEIVDEDDPHHIKYERIYYDPLEDEDPGFPMLPWMAFFAWRTALIAGKQSMDALKNSSGATDSDASVEPSPAPTASTPAR